MKSNNRVTLKWCIKNIDGLIVYNFLPLLAVQRDCYEDHVTTFFYIRYHFYWPFVPLSHSN